jgi:hypothetical protein
MPGREYRDAIVFRDTCSIRCEYVEIGSGESCYKSWNLSRQGIINSGPQ